MSGYPQQPYGQPQQPHGQPPQGQSPYGQYPPQYHQPYGQPPQQPFQVHVANQHTRTVHGVGCLGKIGWYVLIVMTCGLAWPFYSRAKRTSRHY
ncbi:hypothetical protein ABZZ17_19600 [Streptomyces sp. NPDC006512]|uniref:hypothetical protein n=1 Tax=Streptomyces sp. NPDC006512 TaxID=3154307 RepID=UPI0033A368D1